MTQFDFSLLNSLSKRGFPPGHNPYTRTFYSPEDDVHGVLTRLLTVATTSLVVAMYGFDDDQLADIIRKKIAVPGLFVQLSFDSTQAAGTHEQALLAKQDYPATSIAYGQSEHGAIMHMKVAIIDGQYLVTGSTNWSDSGERLQDNELTVIADPLVCAQARTRCDIIHDGMLKQMAAKAAGK